MTTYPEWLNSNLALANPDMSFSSLQPSCQIWDMSHKSTTVVLHLCVCMCVIVCTLPRERKPDCLQNCVSDHLICVVTIRNNRRRNHGWFGVYFCPGRCLLCSAGSGRIQDRTIHNTLCPEEQLTATLIRKRLPLQTPLLLTDLSPCAHVLLLSCKTIQNKGKKRWWVLVKVKMMSLFWSSTDLIF